MTTRIHLGTLDLTNHMLREFYGDFARYRVPPPDAARKRQAAKLVLAIAGADGKVSPAEREAWIRFLHVFGLPAAEVEALRTFDPKGVALESLLTPPLSRMRLYDGIRVARVDGFHAKERDAVQRVARTIGVDPAIVPAMEALLDVEDAVRASRYALLRSPKAMTGFGTGPLVEAGAAVRAIEFGQDPGPVPLDVVLKVGKAILAVAAADRALTETETSWFLGLATSMGAPPAAIEELLKFDPVGAKVEDHVDANLRPLARLVLFDAIRTARADGYAEREREMARRGARSLGLDPSVADAMERQLAVEDALREARVKVLSA